jgi:hypothetical protein
MRGATDFAIRPDDATDASLPFGPKPCINKH